jgi:hypothetical protein
MGVIFAFSWLAQSIAGRGAFNEQQLSQLQDPVSWAGYVVSSDFWNRTLQNWQSEFLAVGGMVVLSIYLRQRGSPESKPVGTSHPPPAPKADRAATVPNGRRTCRQFGSRPRSVQTGSLGRGYRRLVRVA